MESLVQSILEWISANPHLAGLAVFLIAFLESLAIIGLAMPGWLLLVGVGSLIGSGVLNFWLITAFSFAGAAAGQAVSYGVGYHYKEVVHNWSFLQKHEQLLTRTERFFERYGFWGILIGQFIGPIRAVIALIAGMLNMPPRKFLFAVVLAALIWAPVYLMPGVVLGAALTFDKQQVWILLTTIVLSCFALVLMVKNYKAIRKTTQSSNADPEVQTSKPSKFRLGLGVVMALGVSGFLLFSDYGPLMVDLSQKIWQVIGF